MKEGVRLNGKNGFALVLVIILIAFLSIVAIGLVALWQGAVNQLVQQESSMQAYYLARSGAAALATWVMDHPSTATSIIGVKSKKISLKNGSVGTVQVSLIKNNNTLTVVSTGMVNSAIETLKLTLVQAQSGFNFTKAIIAKSIPSGIAGGVGTGGIEYQGTTPLNITGGGAINGGIISNASVNVSGGASISGGITSKATVNVSGGGKIFGGIIAGGGFITSGGPTISGGVISNSISNIGGGSISGGLISASAVTVDGGSNISGGIISNSIVSIPNGTVSEGIKSKGNVSLTWSSNISGGIITSGNVTYPQNYNPNTPIFTGVSNPFAPSVFPQFPSFPQLTKTPLPEPPSGLKNMGSLTLPQNVNYSPWYINAGTISQSGSYSSINLSNGSNLTIDTSNGTLTLYVNDFEVTGGSALNIKGNGALILFVNNFSIRGGSVINNSENNNIFILSNNPSGNIHVSGGANLNGNVYVYAPSSSVSLSGSTQWTGGVVAGSVSISGGVSLKPAFLPTQFQGSGSSIYSLGSWSY